jgi:T5orf172 domain
VRGYVYAFMNPAMPGLIKIGGTERLPEKRAAELSGTGVPFRFVHLYPEPVSDWIAAEAAVHKALATARVSRDREFFRIEPRVAVQTLIAICRAF